MFAGSYRGYKDALGTAARFDCPKGITIDQKTGILFVSDFDNHLIRMITPKGISLAPLFFSFFLLYLEGEVCTLAGHPTGGYRDTVSVGELALFNNPRGICVNKLDQSLFICDYGNDKIRRISASGMLPSITSLSLSLLN